MRTDVDLGIFDAIIFLGIFQRLLLAVLFLKYRGQHKVANLYQGLFMLALSLAILEELLNNTGYIVRLLAISNFAEPLNLAYGPLFLLYVKRSLHPTTGKRRDWYHFLPFLLYLGYMFFFFLQPEAVKYNAHLQSKHPGWPMLATSPPFPEDPLGIRSVINPMTAFHFTAYLAFTFRMLAKASKDKNPALQPGRLKELKQSTFHFTAIVAIFIATKLYFGRDLGDYFIATYITGMFYLTTFQVMNKSEYFRQPHSFLEVPLPKYQKSSLDEASKEEILARIRHEMEEKRYFTNNLASLSNLASRIHQSTHHVSQVINEKMQNTFFGMIASYRIHEAQRLLKQKDHERLTIEEIAEEVGYNSKSAFNKAFKKITGHTPSEYRRKNQA